MLTEGFSFVVSQIFTFSPPHAVRLNKYDGLYSGKTSSAIIVSWPNVFPLFLCYFLTKMVESF